MITIGKASRAIVTAGLPVMEAGSSAFGEEGTGDGDPSLSFGGSLMADQGRPSADRLENRLEFETLISDTSAALFAAPPEQLDRAVERGLERVRDFFRADRCALLSVSADQQVVRVRLASYAEGLPRVPEDLNLAPMFPWSSHRLLVERRPISISRLTDLPPGEHVERESRIQVPIKSALTLPIETGGIVSHLIALNTVHQEREWPETFVTRLRVLGELLVSALERQAMVAGLREAKEQVSLAAEFAEAGLWILDYRTGVFWATERARMIFGCSPDEVFDVGRLVAATHPDDRDRVRGTIERSARGGEPVDVEYRILPGDGGVRWVASRGRLQGTLTGEPDRLIGVSIDITERKRAENELRDLNQRLIRAHEEERALLARELHDDVTQRLAVLAIDVGRAELAAPGGVQAETMRAVREGLARLSEDIHSLAYQLHPSVLEELGLADALRTECERTGRRGRVELSVELDPLPPAVGRDAALCLFRVAQEALNNVIRHAGARAARVALRQRDGGLLLGVRDDGVGFDPGRAREGRSLGLASMRERVRLVNGTLDIESVPGRGTAIVAWVPGEGGSR
jgi:PAS domain S-box-containing protein